MLVLLKIYGLTILFSVIIIMYFQYLLKNNTDIMDKAFMLLEYNSESNINNPFLYVLIPLFNLVVDAFLIWFICTDKENIQKMLDNLHNNKQ